MSGPTKAQLQVELERLRRNLNRTEAEVRYWAQEANNRQIQLDVLAAGLSQLAPDVYARLHAAVSLPDQGAAA